MPTSTPASTAATTSLAAHWQDAANGWARFWTQPVVDVLTPAAVNGATPPAQDDAVARLTRHYVDQLGALWRATLAHAADRVPEVAPATDDRRFAAPEWRSVAYFSWLRQAWLIHADYVRALVQATPLPAADARRLEFFAAQYLDAIAPSNFAATNPAVQKRAIASAGASLLHGAINFASDLRQGRVTMSDPDAFEIGRNIATTPGSVVFRNDLIEVLQYDATTPTVGKRPLVIIPPCINKYYILDLGERNSLVRHAVNAGHTTFMVSWRNIPARLGTLAWDDYLQQGVLQAIDVAQRIGGSRSVNALGFCVGGTLLASALAVLAARDDRRVASVTLLATMLDFADPGDIGVYVTPEFLAMHEAAFMCGQRMRGSQLAAAFSSLRVNDLVWNYVVKNYLEGRTPAAFDLLYWNGDSTSLPGPMYVYYLREMYLQNRLRERNALTMLGEPVDLSRIRCPAYVLATRDDHIVPWRSAWRTMALLGGDMTFVLGASGHIAGVVNPPLPPRRNFWTGAATGSDADAWLEHARKVDGSWWPHWSAWLAQFKAGTRKAPRQAGNAALPPLGPAPGRYVSEDGE
ncbi:MAG: class I poly(R)-hydroxyalkanoic acid synthase [Betaproteobacteria bacterium]